MKIPVVFVAVVMLWLSGRCYPGNQVAIEVKMSRD